MSCSCISSHTPVPFPGYCKAVVWDLPGREFGYGSLATFIPFKLYILKSKGKHSCSAWLCAAWEPRGGFTLEVDLMIRTSVSEILSPPKKQCILLSVQQCVKEKVIRIPVKMRATTLFTIISMDVSWARDTGLNSKYNTSRWGWIAKEVGAEGHWIENY